MTTAVINFGLNKIKSVYTITGDKIEKGKEYDWVVAYDIEEWEFILLHPNLTHFRTAEIVGRVQFIYQLDVEPTAVELNNDGEIIE